MNSRPLLLALAVTLANAAKPVVIDDTAYLAFAAHVAAHPLDPYGFELFWYDAPEPAMDAVVKAAAAHPVADLVSEPADLETIFLELYRGAA